MIPALALTSRSLNGGRRDAILTDVGVCLPFSPEPNTEQVDIPVKQFVGVWDTGATNTVISKAIVDAVGLQPTGQTIVNTASGPDTQNTYLVNLTLPMGLMFPNLTVTEGKLAGVDALIGMDIICLGDFSVTNLKGHTVMNFRIPSMVEHDYVSDANRFNAIQVRRMNKSSNPQRLQPKKKGKHK